MRMLRTSFAVSLSAISSINAAADEGMWLPNALPLAQMKAAYGFEPSAGWADHLQRSAVRFSTGGSGSLVSAQGLVMTNHHVGSDMLAKLSTPTRDLLETGFLARSRADELPCPDLELDVLWSIEDVTARIEKAANDVTDLAKAGAARRAAIAAIEDAATKATGLKCEVVTLYQGGRFHLYSYKTYRDVRLVFAPEAAIAFFGGDTDNFEFPRFDLDCCFFRIYDNGKPLSPENFLRWDIASSGKNPDGANGAQEGELVFTWGHPGSTNRLYTAEHVQHMRDVEEPMRLKRLWRSEVKLATFMGRSAENNRIAREDFFGVQNGRKSTQGLLDALQDPALVREKFAYDAEIARKLKGTEAGERFERGRRKIVQSLDAWNKLAPDYFAFERWRAGDLAGLARTAIRIVSESEKPSDQRLAEYSDGNRASLESFFYSPAPIQPDLEIERLSSWLSSLAEERGLDDLTVQKLLDGKSPRARASELVRGTQLAEVDARRTFAQMTKNDLANATDPMIRFAILCDGEARAARTAWENEVESLQESGYADVAAAHFAAFGESVYPDATFTLRMSYGVVAGWTTDEGAKVPAFTTIGGTFTRAEARAGDPAFALPKSWLDARARLDSTVPFNFVSTNDIIGGNSGSPIVDRDGDIVGLIFDGNLDSLAGDVIYDGARNRATSVDARGMLHAMRVVYGANELVDEMLNSTEQPITP